MAACPHFERCELHQSIGMKAALGVWQGFYCDRSFERCERYKLGISGGAVPSRLLPNGRLVDGAEDPRASDGRAG